MFNVNAYVLEWFKGFLLMAKDNPEFNIEVQLTVHEMPRTVFCNRGTS